MTGGVWPPGSKEFSMRKALIGLILAATAMVPAAANAQRHHNDGDGDRSGWSGRNNGDGGNRGEARAARSEARNEARQSQPQVQVQQPQVQQQVVERQRGDGGNRGGWNRGGSTGGGERRSWNGGGGDNAGATRGDWNRGGDDGNRGGRTRNRTNQQSVYPQAWQGNPNDPRLEHYRQLEQRNQNGGGRRDWRNDRNDRNNWRDGRRGDRNGRTDWNRGWRNDNRYNWSSWRNQNRNRYHLSPYYSPYRNWRYQRFSIGLFLDSLFYDQRYWIGNPYDYRLPAAPYGTQWVRYYDDVILVDVYTGEVLDVIYDFFW